jgi:hypothetical protein
MPETRTITVRAAENAGRWIIFKDSADLSAYDESRILCWAFESRPNNAGTKRRTMERVKAAPGKAAFGTEYEIAFAEVHCAALTGPDGVRTESPRPADFEALNPLVLSAYVFRADTNFGFTDEDFDALKKKPSGTPDGSA